MRLFHIFVALVLFIFSVDAFALTVSGEIGQKNTIRKPNTSISVIKKPAIKLVSRTVTYTSPMGKDRIQFIVRVKNGIITSARAIPRSNNAISKILQKNFAKGISKVAVGKQTKNFDIVTLTEDSFLAVAFEQFIQKSFQ